MPVLYIAQEQNGFISNEVMEEVAIILDMTPEEVLGVVTFYTMYHQNRWVNIIYRFVQMFPACFAAGMKFMIR